MDDASVVAEDGASCGGTYSTEAGSTLMDEEAIGLAGIVFTADLGTSGTDVRGGGKGVPLLSPLILRLNGGSNGKPLPFFPEALPSLLPVFPRAANACLRSASSKDCS